MNTYTIIGEGNPIIPYTLQVDLSINATDTYTERVASALTGEDFDNFFAGYAENSENAFKTHPDFTTQDETRNATITNVVTIGENVDDPSKTDYDITYSFGVSGAVATFEKQCQSSSEGTELEEFFATKVVEVEFDFYNVRPQWVKN